MEKADGKDAPSSGVTAVGRSGTSVAGDTDFSLKLSYFNNRADEILSIIILLF